MELRKYQEEAIEAAWSKLSRSNNALIVMSTGLGKCLGKHTPVLMHDGSIKKVQDIIVGDKLMGPDSLPRTVLSIATGKEEMFKITPIKGESWTCNRSHILSLKSTSTYRRAYKKNQITNISVNDYLKQSSTFKHMMKLWRVGVDFKHKEIPLDPYFLGLWLGDGTFAGPTICKDVPVLTEWLTNFAVTQGLSLKKYTVKNRMTCYGLTLNKNSKGKKINKVREYLKIAKINNEKRIPHIYLTSSKEQRLKLLAGIFDTDGHLSQGGFEVITKYEGLKNDIAYLARSLGMGVTTSIKKVKLKQWDDSRNYHRISIYGDFTEVPCLQEKNKSLPRKQKKDILKTGFSIESLGIGEYFGFEIDGDRLFLLGDFTVTHNTATVFGLMQKAIRSKPNINIVFAVNRRELLKQTFERASQIFPAHWLGIYTGGGRKHKQIDKPITIGTIQSLVKAKFEKVHLIILDECHRVSLEDESNYFTFLKNESEKNPKLKIVGLTATPFRSTGIIYGENQLFDSIAYEKGLKWSLAHGFLVPPRLKKVEEQFDTSDLHLVAGDYDQGELEELTSDKDKITAQIKDALPRLKGRKKIVWACSCIKHADLLNDLLIEQGENSVSYHSKTLDRDKVMHYWKNHGRHMTFVSIISEGFDFPPIDAVCLGRPTRSPVLYIQTVGRGLRPFPSKEDALILDYGRVVENCGPLDAPKIPRKGERNSSSTVETRFCEKCLEYILEKDLKECPSCGHIIPIIEREINENKTANLTSRHNSKAEILSKNEVKTSWIEIADVKIDEYTAKSGSLCTRIKYMPSNVFTAPIVEYCVWGNPWSNKMAYEKLMKIGIDAKSIEEVKGKSPKIPKAIKVAWTQFPEVREVKYDT